MISKVLLLLKFYGSILFLLLIVTQFGSLKSLHIPHANITIPMIQNSKDILNFLLYVCFIYYKDEMFNILGFSSSMHAICIK